MNPAQLKDFLLRLVRGGHEKKSVMIWGPPGIGKSSVVAQVGEDKELPIVDLRLSQLAPTDLRGLPMPDKEQGVARWLPPSFLPTSGKGILFLDEFNMAPPVMMGIAQQLILDRKVGDYTVPDGWFIWAAGNRKSDKATVFELSAPLANRFLHLSTGPDFQTFLGYMLRKAFNRDIVEFLAFQPSEMYRIDEQNPSWPSPRSWEMANGLYSDTSDGGSRMPIEPAVGAATASQFEAFKAIRDKLVTAEGKPIIELILKGEGAGIDLPPEKDVRYAIVTGASVRVDDENQQVNLLKWLVSKKEPELFALSFDISRSISKAKGFESKFNKTFSKDPALLKAVSTVLKANQSIPQ